jgi:hypothetical protein
MYTICAVTGLESTKKKPTVSGVSIAGLRGHTDHSIEVCPISGGIIGATGSGSSGIENAQNNLDFALGSTSITAVYRCCKHSRVLDLCAS